MATTPQKPYFWRKETIQSRMRAASDRRRWSASRISSNSATMRPARAAVRATQYGGISPAAVPAPHSSAAGKAWHELEQD